MSESREAPGKAVPAEAVPTEVVPPGASVPPEVAPHGVSTTRIIIWGIGAWALALVATLVVPSLHEGARDWWPWSCVTGIGLGLFGLWYVRRGRGNATGAE